MFLLKRWNTGKAAGGTVSGAAAAMLCILRERPWLLEELEIPEREFPLRLRYLNQNRLCTIIDVNDREQRVKNQKLCNGSLVPGVWEK